MATRKKLTIWIENFGKYLTKKMEETNYFYEYLVNMSSEEKEKYNLPKNLTRQEKYIIVNCVVPEFKIGEELLDILIYNFNLEDE